MRSLMKKITGISLVALCLHGMPALAETLALEVGVQQRYQLKQVMDQVAVGDPTIADVTIINAGEMLITPLNAGVTNLTMWPKQGREAQEILLLVAPNARQSQAGLKNLSQRQAKHNPDKQQALREMLSPMFNVDSMGNDVVLDGTITALEQHDAIRQIVQIDDDSGVDISRVMHPSQVQIDIKIVEISKSRMQSAGFMLGRSGAGGRTPIAIGGPGVLSSVTSGIGSVLPNTDAFNLVYGVDSKGFLGALSVLEGNGFAYTLAEPSLMAMSGQSANFLAGGEFPVPIRGGMDNSVTVEYKEFGVRLSVTPTVLDKNRIALKVAPEVSELDFNAGIQTGGVTVPALRVRRTDTSVSLGNGESFVISGLISQNTVSNVDKVPWLGDIPILGAFFRSNDLAREDRELLMIVTPHLVNPLARDAELPQLPGEQYRNYEPNFAEFFFLENGRFNATNPVPSGFSR